MKKVNLELTSGEKFPAIIIDEELIYGVTAIAIGINNNYIKIESAEGKVNNLLCIHPLTSEKLPVILLNNASLQNSAMMLIPAHVKDHFELAKKFHLPYKQVIAPYFKGKDLEALIPNVETQFRKSVIAVIKNEKDNTYLCVNAIQRICKSFVLGGIEQGETPEQAAIREVIEETGYTDIIINRRSIFELHNHFYAAYKGVNRYAYMYVVFGTIKSKRRKHISEKEKCKQEAVWIKKNDLKNFLSVNNNIFVNNYLLDNDCAYEGDGIMINSKNLNGKLRSDIVDLFSRL